MARITKAQKKKFADAFMILQSAREAMAVAGIEFKIESMQSLMLDKKLADYIDENVQTVQYMLGRTKEGHIAKLEKLFDMATGEVPSKQFSFTKSGKFVEVEGKFTDYKGASSISKRLGELLDWETTDDNNNIVVDLKIDDNLFKADNEEQATENTIRDEKVLNHLKAEGVL